MLNARDHPRRCGENLGRGAKPNAPAGSPPQVRGKQEKILSCERCLGITPAGAGKTQGLRASFIDTQDHPRRCGENDESAVLDAINTGSPPQVRGKPGSTFIIP